MSRIIADLMTETLRGCGVQRIYGVVGDSLNGFTDSLRRQKTIEWIHMRHEEAAAFAARRNAIEERLGLPGARQLEKGVLKWQTTS